MSARTPSRDNQGLTLVETIISIFLLLCACLVVIALFHTSLRYSARILQQNAAAEVASKTMARVRAWARMKPAIKFNFEQPTLWNVYDGDPVQDPEDPNFKVSILQAPHTVYSPCSELEKQFDSGRRRPLSASFHRVTVTVRWDPPLPTNQLSITSLIGSPAHRMPSSQSALKNRVDISEDTYQDPLPYNQANKFTVSLNDSDDQEIPDVMFTWHVIPGIGARFTASGNGIIDPNHSFTKRTGQQVAFRNNFPTYANPWAESVKGEVAVGVVAVYRGLHCENRSRIWTNQ